VSDPDEKVFFRFCNSLQFTGSALQMPLVSPKHTLAVLFEIRGLGGVWDHRHGRAAGAYRGDGLAKVGTTEL